MAKSVFGSQREFNSAAVQAGVNGRKCAWVATTELIDGLLGLGIDISSEEVIRKAYNRVRNNLGTVEVRRPEEFSCAATIGCRACQQELVICGPKDAQAYGTKIDDERCLTWEQVQEAQ